MNTSKPRVLLSMWCALFASACATRPPPAAQSFLKQPDQLIDAFLAERTFNVIQRLEDLPQDVLDLIEKRQDGSIAIAEPGEPWNASSSWHIRSGVSRDLAIVVQLQGADYVGTRTFVRIYDRRRRAGVTCLVNPSAREWDGSNHTRGMFRARLSDGSSCVELGTWLVGVPPRAEHCGRGGDPRYSVLADPGSAYAASDAAFVGEVVELVPIDSSWSRITMRVREPLKHDVDEQVSFAVSTRNMDCWGAEQGTRYVVFARHRPKELPPGSDLSAMAPSVPGDGGLVVGSALEIDSTHALYSRRVESVLSWLRALRAGDDAMEISLGETAYVRLVTSTSTGRPAAVRVQTPNRDYPVIKVTFEAADGDSMPQLKVQNGYDQLVLFATSCPQVATADRPHHEIMRIPAGDESKVELPSSSARISMCDFTIGPVSMP